MSEPSNEELRRRVAKLESALEELRREIESSGPPTPPRRPSSREMLRFTERAAIPALIVLLETNIRILRSLQRSIRAGEGGSGRGTATSDVAATVGRQTLDRVDDVLGDVQRVLEADPRPQAATEVLEEASRLRDELEAYVDQATRTADHQHAREKGTTIEIEDPDASDDGIDVDAELDSIRDEVRDDDHQTPSDEEG